MQVNFGLEQQIGHGIGVFSDLVKLNQLIHNPTSESIHKYSNFLQGV